MATIKISQLPPSNSNLSLQAVIPFSTNDPNGVLQSYKDTIANIGNLILQSATGAGPNLMAAANAISSQTVTNAAQPNITSVGTLTSLTISGHLTANTMSINNITTGNVSVTGFVRGQSVISNSSVTAVTMTATGTITGGDIVSTTGKFIGLELDAQLANTTVNNIDIGMAASTMNIGGVSTSTIVGGNLWVGNELQPGRIRGHLIPVSNITYDIGNATHRWRDLYLSNNTIFIGNGTIRGIGHQVVISNLLVNNLALNTPANLRIGGGTAGQFLKTDGTGVLSWATIGAGGAVLPIANGTSVIDIPVQDSDVTITTAGAYQWLFGADGNLTLPVNAPAIKYANGMTVLGNVSAANFDGNGSNILFGNGIFAQLDTSNISGLGNIATINRDGNASNVLLGSGVFAQLDRTKISGLGNIVTVNIDGNASNVLYGNGAFAAKPNTVPAGSNTQVQFNDNGIFGGDAGLTFDKTTDLLTVTGNVSAGNHVASGNVTGANLVSTTGRIVVTATTAEIANTGPATVNVAMSATVLNLAGSSTSTTIDGTVDVIGSLYAENIRSSFLPTLDDTFTLGNSTNRWANLYISTYAELPTVANLKILGGTSGQYLRTDGSGGLSWAAVSVTPAGTNTQVQFNDNGVLAGNANLTFDKTTQTLSLGSGTLGAAAVTAPAGSNILLTPAAGAVRFAGNIIPTAANTWQIGASALRMNQIWGNAGNFSTLAVVGNANVGNIGGAAGVFTGTVSGANLSITGNANVGNLGATTIQLTGTGTAVNASGGNILTNQVTGTQFNFLSGAATVSLKAASGTGSYTFTLPPNDGTAGQILITDGSGVTTWSDVPAGGANSEVQYNNNGVLAGVSTITISSGTGLLTANALAASFLKANTLANLIGANIQISSAANLQLADVSSNDGRALVANSAGGALRWANIVSGSNTQVLFNDSGNVGANANLTFDKATNILSVPNIAVTGNITGNTNGFKLGYLTVPQLAASDTTLALSDAGKHYHTSATANYTLTIPTNATTAFDIGSAISIVVQSAGNILVNAASGVTLYMAGSSTAGNRVVGSWGMATLLKVGTDTWFINGTGVV